jgi:hypothetical protein
MLTPATVSIRPDVDAPKQTCSFTIHFYELYFQDTDFRILSESIILLKTLEYLTNNVPLYSCHECYELTHLHDEIHALQLKARVLQAKCGLGTPAKREAQKEETMQDALTN